MKKRKETIVTGIIALLFSQILIKIIGLVYKLYLTNKTVGAATVKYAIKNTVKRKVCCVLDIQILCVAN